jgi:hypothetical protein
VVPGERIELPTNGLQNRCSTAELTRQRPIFTVISCVQQFPEFGVCCHIATQSPEQSASVWQP